MRIRGKVWKFGNDINTDLIWPHAALRLPPEEQGQFVFSDNRPGWSADVVAGDLIVSGRNFGTGSARPAAVVLKRLGIGGILSDSINGVFFRNCIGYGLPALQGEGISELFSEGDVAEFDLKTGEIINLTTGLSLKTDPVSSSMLETIEAGGTEALLRQKGYLE
jgi:3-isopropylmalate/(R)-2-methylmalate dehydratase small subunit